LLLGRHVSGSGRNALATPPLLYDIRLFPGFRKNTAAQALGVSKCDAAGS
jgi:hypothetical protein